MTTTVSSGAPKVYLNEFELSDFIGVKVKTLRQWRFRRIGPPYLKLGVHVRYAMADVTAWCDAGRVQMQEAA